VGLIEGGTNTNVVPGKVVFKLDRRMIPEELPAHIVGARRTAAGWQQGFGGCFTAPRAGSIW